jgi:ubiquinone/menaquinone biosynthesis C-methylase UbiE
MTEHDKAFMAARNPRRVLEVAAGTGVVTRALSSALPSSASIVATDLNQSMIDEAARRGTARPVEWKQADAMQLPFEDQSFDAVVCQFGVMFFPDKPRAFAETRRVLAPAGTFLGTPWLMEIVQRKADPEAIVDIVTDEIEARLGDGPVDGRIQAIVVTTTA